ncbi:hypothetical protein ACIA8I_37780 [Streptomyces rishiriensis]|uniref:hypothetical protein n=1 Tax=Streptomyces rishiriensis TaxID=68264 RepID=UPI00378E9DFF
MSLVLTRRVLGSLRTEAVAALLEEAPAAGVEDVVARLGYGAVAARTALAAARAGSGEPLTAP